MIDVAAQDDSGHGAEAKVLQLLGTSAGKVGLIVGLILLLQIPQMMVSNLIGERQARSQEALTGFQRGWGPEQVVSSPLLIVPYHWIDRSGSTMFQRQGWARIPSSHLNVAVELQPQIRRRGLFGAIVYAASVTLSGGIAVPTLEIKGAPDAMVDWSAARLVVGASDLRGLPENTRLDWNGGALPLGSAEIQSECSISLLSFPAGLPTIPTQGTVIPFQTLLTLRGTQAFHLVPLGAQVDLQVSAPWKTPSFTGATLPLAYETGAKGFTARWEMAGDPASMRWQPRAKAFPDCLSPFDQAYFDGGAEVGVTLQEPVPTYLMVSRAVKYAPLFLVLSFLTLFLLEMLSGVRAHLMQYGLLGLSVSLFALLLISIAEPLGFTAAYAISTAAVLGQASLYTLSVVSRWRLAGIFAAVLGGLFGFLYIVLSLDAYALLAGTVALFIVLSIVMRVTRRLNWAGTA